MRSGLRVSRRSTIIATPLTSSTAMNPKNIHPIGEVLNAWTLVKIPLRVKNVAKLHKSDVRIASPNAVFFRHWRWRHAMRA